jgi:hypothetical protein
LEGDHERITRVDAVHDVLLLCLRFRELLPVHATASKRKQCE